MAAKRGRVAAGRGDGRGQTAQRGGRGGRGTRPPQQPQVQRAAAPPPPQDQLEGLMTAESQATLAVDHYWERSLQGLTNLGIRVAEPTRVCAVVWRARTAAFGQPEVGELPFNINEWTQNRDELRNEPILQFVIRQRHFGERPKDVRRVLVQVDFMNAHGGYLQNCTQCWRQGQFQGTIPRDTSEFLVFQSRNAQFRSLLQQQRTALESRAEGLPEPVRLAIISAEALRSAVRRYVGADQHTIDRLRRTLNELEAAQRGRQEECRGLQVMLDTFNAKRSGTLGREQLERVRGFYDGNPALRQSIDWETYQSNVQRGLREQFVRQFNAEEHFAVDVPARTRELVTGAGPVREGAVQALQRLAGEVEQSAANMAVDSQYEVDPDGSVGDDLQQVMEGAMADNLGQGAARGQ